MKTSLKTLLLFSVVGLFTLSCDKPSDGSPAPRSEIQDQEPGPFDDNESSAD